MQGKDLQKVSKILRRQSTPWERRLWYYIRAGRFYGLKFKRQVPMGDFVVDFCCQNAKLVIELDGGGHASEETKIKDQKKQKFLEQNGYQVLRFWNNEVYNNIEGILETVRNKIKN